MRYGVLNLFALLIVLFLALENYEVWTHPIKASPEKETAGKSGAKIDNPALSGSQKEPASLQSYIAIAEKNIFSPERKDFPVQPSSELKKAAARPEIILYGVTLADEYQRASIVSPGRPLYKGERETKSLKVGEKIGEYKLAKILPDRIMMEGAADSFEVLLYDSKMPKRGMEARTESKPMPAAGMQAALAPPAPAAPVPASATASAEAAKPAQEKLTASPSTTKPATPPSRSRAWRKGRRLLSPPAEIPTQATPAN